jgi:hypothetical protein
MIQIDGHRRQVFINFHKSDRTNVVLQATKGCAEFRHETGELSMVQVDLAGMGKRRIRLSNLPPEVPDRTIREALAQYGEVKDVNEQSRNNIKWNRHCGDTP